MRAVRVPSLVRAALGACAGVLALACVAHAAPKKTGTADLIWARPDAESLGIESIGLLPAATYDNSLEADRIVGQSVGLALKGTGYRWVSPVTARILITTDAEGEALLKQAREGVLKDGRVDSLLAPRLCARLRTDAVLSVRVDQWEQRVLDRNEAGKPSTAVVLRAALVDSLGRLVWSAAGSEYMEGPEQQSDTRQPALSGGTFGRGAASTQALPPPWSDVLAKLLARWTPHFPAKAAPAGAAPAK